MSLGRFEHTLDVVPLSIPVFGNVRLEIDFSVRFLLFDDQDIATVHRCHKDAFRTKQIVISFVSVSLFDLLDYKWNLDVLSLLNHRLVDQIFLWLSSNQLVASLFNKLILELALLSKSTRRLTLFSLL